MWGNPIVSGGGGAASYSEFAYLASLGALSGEKNVIHKLDLDTNLTFTLPSNPEIGDECGWLITEVGMM
jgi:hypothetical protein